MLREKYSEELKANILIDRKKREFGSRKIARKFGVHDSAAKRISQQHNSALKCGLNFKVEKFSPEFEKISPPDEDLQSSSQKIDFYKTEAEKYKNLSKNLEKQLGLLKPERDNFSAKQIKTLLERHELSEIDGDWVMSHDDFMDFFTEKFLNEQ